MNSKGYLTIYSQDRSFGKNHRGCFGQTPKHKKTLGLTGFWFCLDSFSSPVLAVAEQGDTLLVNCLVIFNKILSFIFKKKSIFYLLSRHFHSIFFFLISNNYEIITTSHATFSNQYSIFCFLISFPLYPL